jgi:AcrR family transcriptional regulator
MPDDVNGQGPRLRSGKQRRPPRRSPQPPKRREELLARAAQAFRDKGFEASTTQDIADSLGILRGSLYYYIESKDDLLFEIVQDFHRRTLSIWETARQTEGDTLLKIRAFLTAYVVHVIDNPVEAAVFFRDFRSLSAARQRRLVKERDEYWNGLRELVIEGQREAVICPDVDINVVQHGILGMVNFLSLYAPTAKVGVEELASHYTDFILAGLCCDPATHRPGHRAAVGALPPGFVDDLRREANGSPKQHRRPLPAPSD